MKKQSQPKRKSKEKPHTGPSEAKFLNGLMDNDAFKNGLSNLITGLNGFPGAQLSQVDTLFVNLRWYLISNMRQPLSQIYAEHGLIRTIIDVPVDDALRGGVIFKSKQLEPSQVEELQNWFEHEGIIETAAEAGKWNRLFGGAGIVLITDQPCDQPLNLDAIGPDTPMTFRAVDMWELFWSKQNTSDYGSAMAQDLRNDPTPGSLDPLNSEVEYFDYYGKKLHCSRVMMLKGLRAPSFIRPRLRGWGLSEIEVFIRSINQYLKATDLTFEVLDEFKVDVFKIKNLTTSLQSAQGESAVRRRIQLANQQKNYQSALTMDSEDDWDHKQLSFTGMAEVMSGIRMQVASDLRMPLTKIFGISAAGFSSGEDDIENYNAMIQSTVRGKLKRPLLHLGEIACQKLFGMIPDDLTMEFKPLRDLSAEQEENVKTQKFNRVIQAKQAGEIDSKEFRDSVNKDNLLPIQLETDDLTLQGIEDEKDAEAEAAGGAESAGGESGKAPASTTKAKDAPVAKNSLPPPVNPYFREWLALDQEVREQYLNSFGMWLQGRIRK